MAVLIVVSAFATRGRAQETIVVLDPEKTTVTFTLAATLHTVHGTFRLKSGTIGFNPSTGTASGMVVVDATSGQTGNQRRDRNMHRDVLQSYRYPEITFRPTRVKGKILPGTDSQAQVEGVLTLLGADHSITLQCQLRGQANDLHATTQLVIPYVAWGLKNPSNVLLHVADKVDLSIAAVGRLTTAPPQN